MAKKKVNVLLTGCSGFIGSNVLKYFIKNTDWEFTCVASWRHKGSPTSITPNPRVRVVTHDLVGPMPDLGDFDYIVHMASESHVDRSITDPVNFIENNVSSTLQILEYARKHKPKMFIQFSTDEVYGANHHEEWDVLLPSNPYSASKAAQEMIAIAYWKTYKLPIVITNSNNIIGKNQDAEKFVPKIIELIKENKTVTIHTANGKPGKRHWNPVDNISDALLYILNLNYEKITSVDRPPRFNMPGGEELDNLEMAQLVAKLMGKKLKFELVDAESIRPGYDEFYAVTDGALTELGYKAPQTLKQGLAWLSANKNKKS